MKETPSVGEEQTSKPSEDLLQAIEAALLCIDEGNIARAAQLLYQALPPERRPR